MNQNSVEKINTHLPEAKPVDSEKENSLKELLLTELASASSFEDLAQVKAKSLEFDERSGYRMEVHKAIISRFEELLVNKTQELIS